jgi:cyclophilin family peptidyl-prolyl cis-trans isomerase
MISSLPRVFFLAFLLPGVLSVAAQERTVDSAADADDATLADGFATSGTDSSAETAVTPAAQVLPTDVGPTDGITGNPLPPGADGSVEGPPEGYQEEFDARVARFQSVRQELEKELLRQREIYIRYINREDRSPAAKQGFYAQRQKVRALLDETYQAALDTARMGIYEEAATFIVTMIQHRVALDIYDGPTMEGAARMIDGGSNLMFMYQAAARSAVVVGEFEMAKRLLDAIDDEQMQELKIDRTLEFLLDQYKQNFEAEKVLREIETKEDRLPRVAIRTTQGDVVVELFLDQAPSAVSHFIGLVEQGFYDDLDFHQVIDNLLALTGDSSGDGSGNSGQFLMDEYQLEGARKAFRGSLVMAKLPMGDTGKFIPHSASSQFAILFLPMISVSDEQTVFGRVIEGMDVISRLRRVDPSKKKAKGQIDLPPDRIIEASVIRRPDTLPEPIYLDLSQQR